VQAAQARYAEALESLLHDMKVHDAYNLLGEAAMRRGDYMPAQRYFQLAIRESPKYFEAAQKNLVVVNERLASEGETAATLPATRGEPSLRVVLEDTKVYFDGKVVGLARRGERVVVLESKQGRSKVRVRDAAAGADVTGWLPSAVLADRP